MASVATGDLVLLPFPFSDLTRSKLRPAAILADVGRGDWLLCQVTSNPYADPLAISLTEQSFSTGSLPHKSYARPGKLFSAHESIFSGTPAHLSEAMLAMIVDAVIRILKPAQTGPRITGS